MSSWHHSQGKVGKLMDLISILLQSLQICIYLSWIKVKGISLIRQSSSLANLGEGLRGPRPHIFSCIFKMFYDFALKIVLIKCSLILSSETLTLLYFASRMLHVLKSSHSKVRRGGGTWPPLSEFSGSASEICLCISFRTGLSPPSINVAEGLDLKISKYFGG